MQVDEGRRARECHKARTAKAVAEARNLRAHCTAQQAQLGAARVQLQELRAQVQDLQDEAREERQRKRLAAPVAAATSAAALSARSLGGGVAARQAIAQVTALVESMGGAGLTQQSLSSCRAWRGAREAARQAPEPGALAITPQRLVPPEACGPLDSCTAGRSMSLQPPLESRSPQRDERH